MVRAPNGDNKADPDANNGKGDGDHGSDGDHKVDCCGRNENTKKR